MNNSRDLDVNIRVKNNRPYEEMLVEFLPKSGKLLHNGLIVNNMVKADFFNDTRMKRDSLSIVADEKVWYQFKTRETGKDILFAFIRGAPKTDPRYCDLPTIPQLNEAVQSEESFKKFFDRDSKFQGHYVICRSPDGKSAIVVPRSDIRRIIRDAFKEYRDGGVDINHEGGRFSSKLFPGLQFYVRYDTRDFYWKMICFIPRQLFSGNPNAQIIDLPPLE